MVSSLSSLPGQPDPHRWSLLHPQLQSGLIVTNRSFCYSAPYLWNKLTSSISQITMFLRYILRLSSIFWTCCWLVTFNVPLSSQNSPFFQVLSSIAFPNSPIARLRGYLTIAGVRTSLIELVWLSAADQARLASFKAHYNIVLLTYLLT